MGIFGKLLAEVVEGVTDAVDLTIGVTKDVVKSPIRIFGGDGVICDESETMTEDTQAAIDRIKSK